MGYIGGAYVIPKKSIDTWFSLLENHIDGLSKTEEFVSEESQDVFISIGSLHFPWGDAKYDIQTLPIDTPLTTPEAIEGYLIQIFCQDNQQAKATDDAVAEMFKTWK